MLKSYIRTVIYRIGLRKLYASVAKFCHDWMKFPSRLRQRLVYCQICRRIRAYPSDRRIRVLFVVSYSSKWKTQRLYRMFQESPFFEPVIVLTVEDFTYKACPDRVLSALRHDRAFYDKLNDVCEYGVDPDSGSVKPLSEFNPDIVFFQSPGAATMIGHRVVDVMHSALCCYVPYSVETFEMKGYYVLDWFHGLLYFRDAPTRADARYIAKFMPWYARAGSIVGLGHTIFDDYADPIDEDDGRAFVIYAPHFSFPIRKWERESVISSFMENGRQILAYAQAHPELGWLFKPHPSLRGELVENGGWSEKEVDDYYSAWEKLGGGYYDGDYIRLFKRSKALITDCSSFLVEYPLTGKPLIRLIPKYTNVRARPVYARLFDSFYQVHDECEMDAVFSQVLERGEDPLKQVRDREVAALGLGDGDASKRIYKHIAKVSGRNVDGR